MLQSGVASDRAHCEAVAARSDLPEASRLAVPVEHHGAPAGRPAEHPAGHHRDASGPAPSGPDAPPDSPDCCVALGNCASGSFVVANEGERDVSVFADRIGDLVTTVPSSLQPPPDPPPPRA